MVEMQVAQRYQTFEQGVRTRFRVTQRRANIRGIHLSAIAPEKLQHLEGTTSGLDHGALCRVEVGLNPVQVVFPSNGEAFMITQDVYCV